MRPNVNLSRNKSPRWGARTEWGTAPHCLDAYCLVRTGHLTKSPVPTTWLFSPFRLKKSGSRMFQACCFFQIVIESSRLGSPKNNYRNQSIQSHLRFHLGIIYPRNRRDLAGSPGPVPFRAWANVWSEDPVITVHGPHMRVDSQLPHCQTPHHSAFLFLIISPKVCCPGLAHTALSILSIAPAIDALLYWTEEEGDTEVSHKSSLSLSRGEQTVELCPWE